jgi:hypothetical protein
MYMTAFSHGTPEQWLKFMENLNVVIRGNGLDKNGRARFNLTRSSLKGEALRTFNDKAAEQESETKDSHSKCLRAIMEQVFPKDNPLQKQKTYMRNHVFLHLNDKQVSEFCARWKEINNWLDEFPPFGSNQHFPDDQIKEILYSIIPKCWQSYLHRDKFDMTTASVDDFFNCMERYQIADNIDPLLKPKDQSKVDKNESNKLTEKSNDKKRKAKSKKNDSDVPAPKKSCLSYHVPHQSQVNTQSSGLPPRTPSLLENPLTFFTNTRHPSQRYHLSFSTNKDCIFPRNTIVNIDVAPRLPVCHIIT